MSEMLECLVTYCSVKAHRDGMPLQYLCYRIIAGPGPTAEGGVAVITLLGAKDPADSNLYHHLHAVQVGGPRAALMAALNYLDVVHYKDDLARAQTEIERTPCIDASRERLDVSMEWPPAERNAPVTDQEAITVLKTPHMLP